MVLLMCGEEQRIEYFTARNGRIVAQERIDQSCSILELGEGRQDKTHRFDTIKDAAAVADDSVDQLAAFADLGVGLFGRIDRQVLELVDPFDIGTRAYAYIFDNIRVFHHHMVADLAVVTMVGSELTFGHLQTALLQRLILALPCPQVGICRLHAVEGQYRAATIFIAELQPYAAIFGVPLLEDTVAKLSIATGLHLVDIR